MKSSCNHMLCRMNRDIYQDPLYWIGSAFFSGFLFATWSWGIIYVISFLILYEIGYYIYCYSYKGLDEYSFMVRIGIVAGAFMGFLIGRAITETDNHEESIREFRNKLGL